MDGVRRVQLQIVCEDNQHEAFLRRFFEAAGWEPRAIRVDRAPGGRGAGEQFVREFFGRVVRSVRSGHVETYVVAMIDADTGTVAEHVEQLDARLAPRRTRDERVAVFVPRRSIETWLAYLGGEDVDETIEYPRATRERECAPLVRLLKEMCDRSELRRPAPDSLLRACDEWRSRLRGKK